jgi:hypothetical protein
MKEGNQGRKPVVCFENTVMRFVGPVPYRPYTRVSAVAQGGFMRAASEAPSTPEGKGVLDCGSKLPHSKMSRRSGKRAVNG